MDFSLHANAALDWVFNVMKPCDHLLILNILNLKTPSKIWSKVFMVAYAHDIVINDQLKKESQEKLAMMKATAIEKGFKFVETLCKRGDPAKIVCAVAVEDKIDCIVMGRRGMSNLER